MIELPHNATWVTPRQQLLTAGARTAGRVLPAGTPGARRLVRAQLGKMFGAPDLVGDGSHPHAGPVTSPPHAPLRGFLPKGSPTRAVLAEPASIAGGVRSLYVQAAHPLAMAGVTEHSRYRSAPLERLAGTTAWVTTVGYGTVDVVHRQARRVRAMHTKVVGAHEGTPYAASDPRLLVWVSIALTSSLLASQDLFAPTRLDHPARDRFVEEQGLAAGLLDPRFDLDAITPDELTELTFDDVPLAADGLPRTEADLAATLASYHDELEVTDAARDAIGFLHKVEVPPAVRPVYSRFLDGVAASVPQILRQALGQQVGDGQVVTLATIVASMRLATGRSPAFAPAEARSRPSSSTTA